MASTFMTITRDYGELSCAMLRVANMKCKTYRYVKIQDLAGQIFNVQDLGVVNDTCKNLQESKTFGLFANLGTVKLQFS